MLLFLGLLSFACTSWTAESASKGSTTLGVDGARFTLNGEPAFLLGFSYYGGLGAPEEFVLQDLAEFRAHGFNWLRVWATWSAYETNVSAVTVEGRLREPYLSRLRWLIGECDRMGMVVDVTLTRGKVMPELDSHRRAVELLVTELKPYRNWYIDLANERDVGDDRFVSVAELKELRDLVRVLDPQRLVTASFGGHDLSREDVQDARNVVGVDFLCPHRPRHQSSPGETGDETRRLAAMLQEPGLLVPIHYQEPFRRGYTSWEPVASDFTTDLRGAIEGGAAGWCFHNGGQRSSPNERPRRSFDLRQERLFEQLDEEELEFVRSAASCLSE